MWGHPNPGRPHTEPLHAPHEFMPCQAGQGTCSPRAWYTPLQHTLMSPTPVPSLGPGLCSFKPAGLTLRVGSGFPNTSLPTI